MTCFSGMVDRWEKLKLHFRLGPLPTVFTITNPQQTTFLRQPHSPSLREEMKKLNAKEKSTEQKNPNQTHFKCSNNFNCCCQQIQGKCPAQYNLYFERTFRKWDYFQNKLTFFKIKHNNVCFTKAYSCVRLRKYA